MNDLEWKRMVEQRITALETVVEVRKALEQSKRRAVGLAFTVGGLIVAVIALIIRVVTGS